MQRPKSYTVEVSGVTRGNPGLAGVGVVIRDAQGRILERRGRYLGLATPSQASYHAVLAGLEAIEQYQPQHVTLCVDSELIWRQLRGQSPVRAPDLIALFVRVQDLLMKFARVEVRYLPPEMNQPAEEVANVAVDSRGRRTTID
jgi:ribonuclease HI